MMTLEEINNWYPRHLHSEPLQLLREYLQFEILKAIFESPHGAKYTFLGGTCLRIAYGTQRFSGDIHLDNVGLTQSKFEETAAHVQRHLELRGYEVGLKFAYKGAFHCNVRFPSLLYTYGLSPHKEARLLVKLDTEKQHFDYERTVYSLNRFGVRADILITPLPLLASQKIAAIMGRKCPKGRDFYDLVFILQRAKPNYRYLIERFQTPSPNHLRDAVNARIADFDFNLLAEDVRPFLMNEEDVRTVANFREYWQDVPLR